MASKLSGLGAVTGTNADDLVYLASTQDAGSTYSSKRIKISNLFSSVASGTDLGTFTGDTIADNASVKAALQALETALEAEVVNRASAVTSAVDALVDSAPGTLDTLNEIAAALNDDASAATTLTALATANEVHIDNAVSLTGVAKDATNLGTFTGSTVSDSKTIKEALQQLETALEAEIAARAAAVTAENTAMLNAVAAVQSDVDQNESDADAAVAANEVHIDNLATLTGVAKDSTGLGNFTGSTITNGTVLKTALQELETAQEAIDAKTVDTGNNVNVLVANTTPDATPATFYFLAVDAASGAIKVVNKDFVEVE
jgi:hypothetical protein